MTPRWKRVAGALLLGPLTIIVTPLVTLILVAPLLLLSLVSVKANLVGLFAKALHLEDAGLGGYFMAVLGVGALLAMVGDATVAFVSYRIYRSRSLAALTLGSALLTNGAVIAWTLYSVPRQSANYVAAMDSASAELDRELRTYAKLGVVRYEASEPLDGFIDNEHPELGPVYRKLTFLVPVEARHAATYHLYVRYSAHTDSLEFHTGLLEAVDTLAVGAHEVPVEFDGRNAGYPPVWSPASMGGKVTVELEAEIDRMSVFRFYDSKTKRSGIDRSGFKRDWEATAREHPWMEMKVDSAATEFSNGVRYPKDSRWAPPPKPSRGSDREGRGDRRPQ